MIQEILAADIGGTHARFAIARIEAGRVQSLDAPVTLVAADHASLALAWTAAGRQLGRALPRAAAIAVAGPVGGDTLKLTNSPWVIRSGSLNADLGVERSVLINDFGAVGHAVAHADASHLRRVCGPDIDLPREGGITIVGPGTGLGVSFIRRSGGGYHVQETEGGHMDFAPLDGLEDTLVARLRPLHRRVSVERIVSGPGLATIHAAIAAIEGRPVEPMDDATLWRLALHGQDELARAALDRLCLSLGAIAGDLALAHGSVGVVIAGGVGARLADFLPGSGFAARFAAKGRFEARLAAMPVKLITHPQPGLFGAAAAFAQEHGR